MHIAHIKIVCVAGAALALSACASSNGVVANGWTVTAAANVEYSAGLSLEKQFATLELQYPAQAPAIRAAGRTLATALITQVTDMEQGSSAAVQAKDAAIQAVFAVLPNLSGIISSIQSSGGIAPALSDVVTFLMDDVIYVGPAVLKANAGAATPLDAIAAQVAVQAAAAAL